MRAAAESAAAAQAEAARARLPRRRPRSAAELADRKPRPGGGGGGERGAAPARRRLTELAPPEEHAPPLATDATQLAGPGREAEGEAEAAEGRAAGGGGGEGGGGGVEAAERRAAVAAAAAATRLDEQAKHFESKAARPTAQLRRSRSRSISAGRDRGADGATGGVTRPASARRLHDVAAQDAAAAGRGRRRRGRR